MHRRDRPVPFPWGSEAYRAEYRRLVERGNLPWVARDMIRFVNVARTIIPNEGELCGAMTRRGTPCRRKPLKNGRCPNHGGLSTGAKSEADKLRALQNLRQYKKR